MTDLKEIQENPFAVYMQQPFENLEKYIGYEEQIKELQTELDKYGVTVILADGGFGKTSLLRTRTKLGWGAYAQNLSIEEIYKILREQQPILDRLMGKPPERKFSKPLFVDECGTLTNPEYHALLTNLNDNGTKLILALNYDQKNKFTGSEYTIFDRKTREIILDGFSEKEIQKFIEKNNGHYFEESVVNHFKNDRTYRKPRELVTECYRLWEAMKDKVKAGGPAKITTDMIKFVQRAEDRSAPVLGNKSRQIFDYISIHPGCARKDIVKSLGLNPNSTSNLIRIMKNDGAITQDDKGRYYVAAANEASP